MDVNHASDVVHSRKHHPVHNVNWTCVKKVKIDHVDCRQWDCLCMYHKINSKQGCTYHFDRVFRTQQVNNWLQMTTNVFCINTNTQTDTVTYCAACHSLYLTIHNNARYKIQIPDCKFLLVAYINFLSFWYCMLYCQCFITVAIPATPKHTPKLLCNYINSVTQLYN